MKPYAILHPYVLRARVVTDFTLPDGRVVQGPPQARWLKATHRELGQVTVERQMITAQYFVHDPSPTALTAGWLRLGHTLAEGFERELSRPMVPTEFARIQLSRGWLI